MFRIVTHRKKGICVAHGCKLKHTKKNRFCSKHNHRYQKHKNLLKYTYQVLKSNARKRKIKFTITLEQFKVFCDENSYLELKGKSCTSMSIDRKDPTKGYEDGNLKAMSLSDNVKKMHDRINGRIDNNSYDYGEKGECEDDLPF